jgi:ParB-like chromosome segregation protein Spo0J
VTVEAGVASGRRRGREERRLVLFDDGRLDAPALEGPAPAPADAPPTELSLDAVWFASQPRELVPTAEMAALVASGRAQPSTVLETLRRVAAEDPYFAQVLADLGDLAASVRAQGVLQPVEIVRRDDRWTVLEGHRRCLASLLAGRSSVPVLVIEDPDDLSAQARAFTINVQRSDWTALEKAEALERLVGALRRSLLAERDGAAARDTPPDAVDEEDELALRVREQVCARVGLSSKTYRRLRNLNRLSPRARTLGRELTEGHLRPVAGLDPVDQEQVVAVTVRHKLSVRDVEALAALVRSGDQEAVRRRMARFTGTEEKVARTSISWEALLHAVPEDMWVRCRALRAELEALPDERRRARLLAMRKQVSLARALADEFERVLADFEPATADPDQT